MYKMLIVDDQIKEIEGIKQMLDWEQINIQIAGYATNGRDGLKKAVEIKPDVIISDIVMPLMDGLEMVEKISEVLPDAKVVFISCFDDFKFAKEAISRRAYGYVLKPVLPGEMLKAVTKVLGVCEEEKKRSLEMMELRKKIDENIHVLKEQFIRSLLLGIQKDEFEILKQCRFLRFDMEDCYFAAASLEFDGSDEEISNGFFFKSISIIEKLKETYSKNHEVYFILIDLTHIAILFTCRANNKTDAKDLLVDRLEDIVTCINTKYDVAVTCGFGTITNRLNMIGLSFRQAGEALHYKFYLGKMCTIDFTDVNFDNDCSGLQINDINCLLKKAIFYGDSSQVKLLIEQTINENYSPSVLRYICHTILNNIQILLSQINQNPDTILGPYGELIEQVANLDTLEQIKNWLNETLSKVIAHMNERKSVENVEIVRKMEEYIKTNYSSQISAEIVSRSVYLSQGYAGYLFKGITGKTIHQYIEDVRMQNAVRLLKEHKDLKIYEIAKKTGFNNSGYFINVFKKVFGYTPANYKKRDVVEYSS